jgi:hypothetical protein
MNSGLEQSLMVLVYTTIIMLVIMSAFFVKLLVDCSNLMRTAHELTLLLNHELEPTLKELKKALDNINSVAETTNKQVGAIKNVFNGAVNSTTSAIIKARGLSFSFLDGIVTGLKLFRKSR